MKNLFTLIVFLITLTISAQAPQGFNYQATVRNNAGALMINKNVTFKFNVMKDTPTSVPVFSETHYVPTDDLGAVNLVIGNGTATSGTFATIDWATGTYYLGIELNTGNGFVAMGTSQLLSVPYALYASNSGNGTSIGAISTTSNPKGATITSGALSLTPADATNGGILTTGSQTIAGTKTFSSDVTVNGITVGKGAGNIFSNTVTGGSSLTANTTGYGNTVNGFSSLANNTTGNNNIAIGHSSIGNNTIGSYNIAIGNGSQRSNYNGNNNIAFGHSAGVSADNLTNTTAIGNGATVTTSNTIQLGNTNVTDVKTAGTITARSFVGDGSQLTNIANNQPWLISTARDTLSFAKQVIIGDKNSINVPPLTVIGTDSGPTSSSIQVVRSQNRNNVIVFAPSEPDNLQRASLGVLQKYGANEDNVFTIGVFDGTVWNNPFKIYTKNRALRYGITSDPYSLNVYGNTSLSLGYQSLATGDYSSTLGVNMLASGKNSTAVGMNSKAIGPGALVFGVNSDAIGVNSTAIGLNSKSIGDGSTAIGLNSTAAGAFSFSAGVDVNAYSFAETAMGRFNTAYSPLGQSNGWSPQDRIFVIGNGESDTVRKDALTILKNGNTTINGQLSVNSHTITNVSNPVNAQDAATKAYVDALVAKITALETRLNNLSPLVTNQEYLYVPGSYTVGDAWNPATSPYLVSMGNGNFEGYLNFPAAGEFRFILDRFWGGVNYGGTNGALQENGNNLNLNAPGYYKINVNLNNFTYNTLATTWSIIGSATSGGWSGDSPMNYNPTTKKWSITTNLITGRIKFRANNQWDITLGDNGANGSLEYNATDIDILAAGNYTIILDLSNPSSYTYSIIKNN